MSIEVRAISREEVSEFRANIYATFGAQPPPDEEAANERLLDMLEPERTYAAFDGNKLVGTSGTYTLELTIPGSTIAMGGLTMVSVLPTHRRRGIMAAMLDAHLADVRARNEPVSGLWCSEATIYGRFGWGSVGDSDELVVDKTRARIVAELEVDDVAILEDAEVAKIVPRLYERLRPLRPGLLARSEVWWRHRLLRDSPGQRGAGGGPLRWLVSRRNGKLTGFVCYRQHPKLESGLATGSLEIRELHVVDATAEASLWRLLLSMDLYETINWWNSPTDSVLPWIVDDARRLARKRLDHLWLLISDVPAALSARRYLDEGSLVFEVVARDADPVRYRLEVESGSGRCKRTTRKPQITLDLAALGSIYMGGVSPRLLAGAGHVHGRAAAIERAERLLRWPVAPWCPEVF